MDTVLRALSLSLSLLTAALWCQDPGAAAASSERGRAFGMARRADGSPWAGATVHLVSRPFAGCQDRDHVEITAGNNGQFTAQLLVGRTYSALAVAADGERWLVSAIVEDIVREFHDAVAALVG